ncbi:alpha-(1,3)-fucosyltransferase 7 [Calliopsis andreniformis]|uniref:alpha-(1,3)-fucosyltransferase 7 n=1 Tax=Calliopsis andreniformis TaxID=337506 RepID=UPI003FCC3B3D
MLGIPRYTLILFLLCVSSTIFLTILITFPDFIAENVYKKTVVESTERRRETVQMEEYMMPLRKRNFADEQINKMTLLGRWLLSTEENAPPPIINAKKKPYLILIWKHGKFLERRHIRHFTNNIFSPWENCTVKNCILSYRSEDLGTADAVVFHLHLTKSKSELPIRKRWDQRWIFLTDESPLHTFLYRNQDISQYNCLFNWSMTYRMDSDVPVPYGRTIYKSLNNLHNANVLEDVLRTPKTKLVAIMGSNCAGKNGRWDYVSELKSILGVDLDIFGKCLNGNVTACPGHFDRDCPALNAYKFYLAFENSNCKEYITEKVFWHGYHKLAVPIIMGPPKKDCESLLPPNSFLHVSDFANPAALANYINYLHQHNDKYMEYHNWRSFYRVINEHGYFRSTSRHYCRICEALHYNSPTVKVYNNMESFWNKKRDCTI